MNAISQGVRNRESELRRKVCVKSSLGGGREAGKGACFFFFFPREFSLAPTSPLFLLPPLHVTSNVAQTANPKTEE